MIEEVIMDCPSCGEAISLDVDTTGGSEQEYTQDCPVCCAPMAVYVRCEPGRVISISTSAE